MGNLKKIAMEVYRCRENGVGRGSGKGFPKDLKKRICLAIQKKGIKVVAQETGIHVSLLSRWREQFSQKIKMGEKKAHLAVKELSVLGNPSVGGYFSPPQIRLTDPSGFILEVNGTIGAETAAIINLFMGRRT